MFNVGDEVYIGFSVSTESMLQWKKLKGRYQLICPCHWKKRKALVIQPYGDYSFVAIPPSWLEISIFYNRDLRLLRTAQQVYDDAQKLKEQQSETKIDQTSQGGNLE